ncbi:hypothetical protein NEDG_00155 [Nematocida displodere]|uniref:Uncharacterized protein n=1 Tax=Nematocida displodere TaxID=1805483 RepID=A0A177EJX8_9MICR|nr:hypothetical protein NEDG_00155 [Nematocida displodere]
MNTQTKISLQIIAILGILLTKLQINLLEPNNLAIAKIPAPPARSRRVFPLTKLMIDKRLAYTRLMNRWNITHLGEMRLEFNSSTQKKASVSKEFMKTMKQWSKQVQELALLEEVADKHLYYSKNELNIQDIEEFKRNMASNSTEYGACYIILTLLWQVDPASYTVIKHNKTYINLDSLEANGHLAYLNLMIEEMKNVFGGDSPLYKNYTEYPVVLSSVEYLATKIKDQPRHMSLKSFLICSRMFKTFSIYSNSHRPTYSLITKAINIPKAFTGAKAPEKSTPVPRNALPSTSTPSTPAYRPRSRPCTKEDACNNVRGKDFVSITATAPKIPHSPPATPEPKQKPKALPDFPPLPLPDFPPLTLPGLPAPVPAPEDTPIPISMPNPEDTPMPMPMPDPEDTLHTESEHGSLELVTNQELPAAENKPKGFLKKYFRRKEKKEIQPPTSPNDLTQDSSSISSKVKSLFHKKAPQTQLPEQKPHKATSPTPSPTPSVRAEVIRENLAGATLSNAIPTKAPKPGTNPTTGTAVPNPTTDSVRNTETDTTVASPNTETDTIVPKTDTETKTDTAPNTETDTVPMINETKTNTAPNTDTTAPNTETDTVPMINETKTDTAPNTDTDNALNTGKTPNTDTDSAPNTDTTDHNTDTDSAPTINEAKPDTNPNPNTDTTTVPNTDTTTVPNTDTNPNPNTDTTTAPNTDSIPMAYPVPRTQALTRTLTL